MYFSPDQNFIICFGPGRARFEILTSLSGRGGPGLKFLFLLRAGLDQYCCHADRAGLGPENSGQYRSLIRIPSPEIIFWIRPCSVTTFLCSEIIIEQEKSLSKVVHFNEVRLKILYPFH